MTANPYNKVLKLSRVPLLYTPIIAPGDLRVATLGLTGSAMADTLGCSLRHWAALESGETPLSPRDAMTMAFLPFLILYPDPAELNQKLQVSIDQAQGRTRLNILNRKP